MRKEWKKQARSRVKKLYGFYLVVCLMMAVLGLGYTSSLSTIKSKATEDSNAAIGTITEEILEGQDSLVSKTIDQNLQKEEKKSTTIGLLSMDHRRGVAAQLVNGVSSGQVFTYLYDAAKGVVTSHNAALALLIIIALLVVLAIRIFVLSVLQVSFKRATLESRIYDHVPIKRFFYLVRVKKWMNVAAGMFRYNFFLILWYFTIVGAFIKGYSYMMIPYILAENPAISPKDAMNLSRRMMDGHKWEAFILHLSFIGWSFLDGATFGLVGVFYSNPYMEATLNEYYAYIRQQAKEKEIPGAELLNDTWLFEKADDALLNEAYSDANVLLQDVKIPEKRKGFLGFMENVFDITLVYDDTEKEYEKAKGTEFRLRDFHAVMNKEMYPARLFTINDPHKIRKMSPLHYDRHYSLITLILMFFSLCMVGWLWEGSITLVTMAKFQNRGVLHGPWIPIYGSGAVIVLILLNKLRKNAIVQFIMAVVLCGALEYTTAWVLETTKGQKWWDYTGYFLNIHGRVCAEGLLVFGIAGIAVVYLLAPFMDNMFRRLPKTPTIIVCVILLLCFAGDCAYSSKHPNTGDGITSVSMQDTETESEIISMQDSQDETEEWITISSGDTDFCSCFTEV